MRKNKKIVAILTLLVFAMSMIVPVAANAAVTTVTLTGPTDPVAPETAVNFTSDITAGTLNWYNELYLVRTDVSPYVLADPNGKLDDPATYTFTTPAATDDAQTLTFALVEAPNGTAALAPSLTPLATHTIIINQKAQPTVAIQEPLYIGDTSVKVNLTNAEVNDTVDIYAPGNTTTPVGTATVVAADLTNGYVEVTIPEAVVGTYTATLTNVTDTTLPNTFSDTAVTQQPPAVPGVAVADASIIEVVDKTVDVNETSTTDVSLRDAFGRRATENLPETIYVWAEERVGQPTSALTEVMNEDAAATPVGNNVYEIAVDGVDSLELKYSRAGQYSVYASLADPNVQVAAGDPNYGENAAYGNVAVFKSTSRVVTVEGDKADVVAIGVDSVNSPDSQEVVLQDGEVYGEEENAYVWVNGELVEFDSTDIDPIYVDPNGVSESDIDFVIYQYIDTNNNGVIDDNEDNIENIEPVDIGIDVTFDTNSNAIKVSKDKDTTDYNGMVDVSVTGTVEGTYKIYVKAGSVEITVPVAVTPLRADDIKVTKQPEGAIASGDYSTGCDFRFQILDPNGMVVSNPFSGNVLGVDGLNDQLSGTENLVGPYVAEVYKGDFVNLVAPNAADMDEEDITIVRRLGFNDKPTGEYCVRFDKDLVAGDYSLEIILDNGRKASFNWTVKDFGTAKELKIEYPRNTVELGGTTAEPDIYFLDENGVKKDAKRYVDLGASGYAIADFKTETGIVTVENDEKYIGDTINVYAVAEREGLTAQATLTVTSGEGALTFDQNRGPVNFNNRVPFKVVDKDGNQLVLGADKQITSATVVVTKQSNPDAKISGNVATYSYNDILEKGTGILNLTSDKEGTAEVKVTLMVRDENTAGSAQDSYRTQVYSGTLDYTFGDASEFDGRIVVMTIGSADTIVDNKIVTIDAAPFVNADWRTMVPFRALAEDFGATVEWNEADQTVTAELDGVTLVMTIGSETYTVNGVEKSMDTAPVIVDGRTYVPVRFPAEAFGFDVVPTYNDEGLTSSVLFTK